MNHPAPLILQLKMTKATSPSKKLDDSDYVAVQDNVTKVPTMKYPAPRYLKLMMLGDTPPFEKLDDPNYVAVTDDGTDNTITDLLDNMEYHNATALCFVSGDVPRYRIGTELTNVPNADFIDLDELMEDLRALGIVYNAYNYSYFYRPAKGLIKELEFVVDTYGTPGIFSTALFLKEKTYR